MGHVSGERLRNAMDIMNNAWRDVESTGENTDRRAPDKECINSFVGYCGITDCQRGVKTTLSFHPHNDAPS